VIVDAPATGHSVPLLATPGTLLKMLPFGPLTSTARDLALLLGDPRRAAVAIVTRAEEMAVNETLELATAIMRIGVSLLPVIVNAVDPFRFTRVEAQRLRAEPPDVPGAWQPYLGVARFTLARQRAAERQIRRLTHALPDRPVCLPQVPAGRITLATLEPLADALARPRARSSRRVS
jgi:anion-transporting  ArsA/GET3 family ATPase